ncbi:MAG: DNA polymerase, partial [Providencia heimbachae]|nr:DNA polymerase [Providencia heimbachae]
MKNILWLDLETFSEKPIKYGTHSYAETVEIMLFAWALNNNLVQVWDVTDKSPMPTELKQALTDPNTIIYAHNSHFDRTMLNHSGIKIDVSRWRDTMVQALAHGLPGALGALCEVLGVPLDKAKDKEGKALIQLFCKPRPKNSALRRATSKTHPEEWKRFVAYAGLDIEAMREVYRRLPSWNYRDSELAHWHRDQQINDRGVCMDIQLATSAIEAVDIEQKRLAKLTQELTDDEVQAATQRDVLLKHISSAFGVDLPDMQKSTIERRINDPDIPLPLRELLAIRLQASTTSTSKYKALMNGVSADGRLRGTLQFCGASRTGRWAGRLFQPQNLPRPTLDQETIDNGIEALKAGCADLIYDDIMQLTSSALRGCIMAPEGKKLVVSDLSNIEGRMLAWLAGESWKVKAFSEFDKGIGADLYKLAYAKPYNMEPDQVDKEQRQIGKVMELACLHGDTLVLTNRGYVKLINIKNSDLLWDGVEWVKHKGLIFKGFKKVMSIAGVLMTPNHQVLTHRGWKQASHIDSNKNTLVQSQELASESLPWSVKAKKSEESEGSTCNAHVERNNTASHYQTYLKVKVLDVISALKKQQKPIVNSIFATLTHLVMTKLGRVCSIAFPPPSHVVMVNKFCRRSKRHFLVHDIFDEALNNQS